MNLRINRDQMTDRVKVLTLEPSGAADEIFLNALVNAFFTRTPIVMGKTVYTPASEDDEEPE